MTPTNSAEQGGAPLSSEISLQKKRWAPGWSAVGKFGMHTQVTENPRAHLELGMG